MEESKVTNTTVKTATKKEKKAAAKVQKPEAKVAKDPKPKDQKKPKKPNGKKAPSQEAGGDVDTRGPSGDVAVPRIVKRMAPLMYRAPVPVLGPVLTPMGTVCVILRYNIRAHVSPAGWVLMVNGNVGGMAGIDTQGKRSGMRHPSGSVHQSDSRIHVVTADGKRATLSPKGITFCSRAVLPVANDGYKMDNQKRDGQLAYVLDDGGPRTTVAYFADFDEDFVVKLIAVGNTNTQRQSCEKLLRESYQLNAQQNCDTWVVGGIKVVQQKSGDCFAIWDSNHCHLKASPDRGTLGISTSSVYATASVPPEPHVFVRNRGRRVHHDGQVLVVRNGSHVASLDAYGDLALH